MNRELREKQLLLHRWNQAHPVRTAVKFRTDGDGGVVRCGKISTPAFLCGGEPSVHVLHEKEVNLVRLSDCRKAE